MFRIGARNRKQRRRMTDSWGYRIHDGAAQFRFELEGALASGDVAELDQCWRTAASTIGGKTLVVDLTSLTAVDDSGRQLLNRWREAGAEFIAGPECAMVDGWNNAGSLVRAAEAGSERFTRPAFQTALPLLALFSLLLPATLRAGASPTSISTPEIESATALARYVAGLEGSQPWGTETIEIEASLPKLKEHGAFGQFADCSPSVSRTTRCSS